MVYFFLFLERMKKVLQNKAEEDEKRMAKLEEELKDAR